MNELEAMLGALPLTRSGVNRDRVMFEAGRASARRAGRSQRAWAACSCLLAVVSIGEGALLMQRPEPPEPRPVMVVQKPVEIPEPVKPLLVETAATDTALIPEPWLHTPDTLRDRLAAQVLRYGLDGLPSSVPAEWGEPSRSILQSHGALPEDLRKELELEGPS